VSPPLLDVSNLCKSFGAVRAVNNVSFSMRPGTILALIGPNGAGKTTCFNLLNGQLAPDSGTVRIAGKDVSRWPPRSIFHLGVGRTFQVAEVFSSMTVRENVQVALLSRHGNRRIFWRPARNMHAAEADALLHRVGLIEHAERPCAVLAYGDLKRLDLAIGLANEPRLLLMDEPAAGMAPSDRLKLMALTADIVRERNIGVLFTEHDMDVVFKHASSLIVFNKGEIIASGDPAVVRKDANVQKLYLGSKAQ
jgi:branched-chain amino acid transport system ATP-binding protein